MKMFRTIGRSIRDAFKSVGRNFSLSLASVACITITLIIIACSILLSKNVSNFTEEIEKDVTIVVFLENTILSDEIEQVKKEILNIENIDDDSMIFKSKATVKEEMQESYEEVKDILSEWDESENPLKDTITVKVNDITKIKETAKDIKNITHVSSVQYGEGLVENMITAFDAIKKVTIIAAISLSVVTLFLIINTIKITIFSRQEEIGIMRLVGASNIRIKLPFIIEGMILGIIGSILPILLVIFGYTYLYNSLGGIVYSSLIKLVSPTHFVYHISLLILIIGILVGMVGSKRAVRRYIKV